MTRDTVENLRWRAQREPSNGDLGRELADAVWRNRVYSVRAVLPELRALVDQHRDHVGVAAVLAWALRDLVTSFDDRPGERQKIARELGDLVARHYGEAGGPDGIAECYATVLAEHCADRNTAPGDRRARVGVLRDLINLYPEPGTATGLALGLYWLAIRDGGVRAAEGRELVSELAEILHGFGGDNDHVHARVCQVLSSLAYAAEVPAEVARAGLSVVEREVNRHPNRTDLAEYYGAALTYLVCSRRAELDAEEVREAASAVRSLADRHPKHLQVQQTLARLEACLRPDDESP